METLKEEFQEERRNHKLEKESMEENNATLQEELQNLVVRLQTKEHLLVAQGEENLNSKNTIKSLTSILQQLTKNLENSQTATEFENEDLREKLREAERKLGLKIEEAGALNSNYFKLMEITQDLTHKLSAAESVGRENEDKVHSLKSRVTELEQQLKYFKESSKDAHDLLQESSSDLARTSARLEATEEKLVVTQCSLDAANYQVDRLSRDLLSAEDDRDDVTLRLSTLERQCLQTMEHFQEQDERCRRLEREVSGLQDDISERDLENKRLRREIRMKQRQIVVLGMQSSPIRSPICHTSPGINSLNLETCYSYSPELKPLKSCD